MISSHYHSNVKSIGGMKKPANQRPPNESTQSMVTRIDLVDNEEEKKQTTTLKKNKSLSFLGGNNTTVISISINAKQREETIGLARYQSLKNLKGAPVAAGKS